MTICYQCSGAKGTQGSEDPILESTGAASLIAGVGAIPCTACGGTGILNSFGV